MLDPHVADPQLGGDAPTGVTLEHFTTPPTAAAAAAAAATGAARPACVAECFTSTSPLPQPGVVRWLRFDTLFVEGCRGSGWLVCAQP